MGCASESAPMREIAQAQTPTLALAPVATTPARFTAPLAAPTPASAPVAAKTLALASALGATSSKISKTAPILVERT